MNSVPLIFGIFPGNLENPEHYKTCSEAELWIEIERQLHHISLLTAVHSTVLNFNLSFDDNPKLWKQICGAFYTLDYLAMQTCRFGVKQELSPIPGQRLVPSDSYWTWYYFWQEYMFTTYGSESIFELPQENLKYIRPDDDWN